MTQDEGACKDYTLCISIGLGFRGLRSDISWSVFSKHPKQNTVFANVLF